MMKIRKIMAIALSVLSLVMICAFIGCGSVEKTTIELNAQSITIGVGDSKRLTATASDGSDVTWASSDEGVATVSTSGVVRGISAGTATITAKANGAEATCTVTVENITVSLDKTTLLLDIEREDEMTATLVATVKNGDNVLDEEITWSSEDDEIATVDENGTVTAVAEGTVNIIAKRKNGNASATCAVTVQWQDKPEGYATIGFSEQNKAVTNTYGYWNDQGWEFGNSVIYDAYYADSANSMAGKAVFEFEVTDRYENKQTAPTIQVTYRSSTATGDEGAMLDVGYFYTLTMDITSTVSGTVAVNDFAINASVEGLEDEVYEFEVEANVTKTITVKFAHYDDGRIHDTTDYSNVESALHLLLGSLEGRAKVTIDNLQWVKGEKAPERPEDATPPAPAVTVPDLSATDAIALDFNGENIDHGQAVENGTYTITNNGEGKSYTVAYENAPGGTYENLFASLENVAGVATGNMFSVTVKNNGETAMKIRFDLAGTVAAHGSFAEARDCALSSIAVDSEGNSVAVSTDTTYDGTMLEVAAGKTVTVYITYTTEGVNGVPTQLLVYFDTATYQDTNTYSGNVTISEFKFADWEAPVEETPTIVVPDVEPVGLPVSNQTIDHVNATEGSTYGTYNITDNGQGKSYTVEYSTYTSTYENLIVSLADTAVASNNTFCATITNNGENAIEIRFNINGKTATQDGNGNPLFDCAIKSVTTRNDGDHTDLTYGGTSIQVAAGETVTLIITYENNGAHGVPAELCIYFNTGWYGTAESGWAEICENRTGSVTLSEFKFANVEE